jgi:addiction module RelE/StbE family toxin
MRVRWTGIAADDLAAIVTYIRRDDISAALKVARVIFDEIAALKKMPNRGRKGMVHGTREIVFTPWPYIAVYEVVNDEVIVLRIRHAAQNWP